MKPIMLFILCLCSYQLQAAACKCNCDPMDIRLCASQNDPVHPCHALCSSSTPGMPAFTACPVTKVTDEITGLPKWVSMCN